MEEGVKMAGCGCGAGFEAGLWEAMKGGHYLGQKKVFRKEVHWGRGTDL